MFPPAQPLTERLGKNLFLTLPREPGVYSMFDRNDRLIYVGQSKDLRKRVGSYRSIHPDRHSRKLVQMVHAIERITWEVCATAEAARLRENELLRRHRPKFNSLNTYPKSHIFIGMKSSRGVVEFCYTRKRAAPGDYLFFGAFKSGALSGFQSLLRLLWTVGHRPGSPFDYPRALLRPRAAQEFCLECGSHRLRDEPIALLKGVIPFLRGYDSGLLERVREKLAGSPRQTFMENLVQFDLENAEEFFRRSALRNFKLREEFGLGEELIEQEQLDDLLARTTRSQSEKRKNVVVSNAV